MSNLVTRTGTVHAAFPGTTSPLCGSRALLLNGNTGHSSVTCGNCARSIAKVQGLALELHQAFLLGVAQAKERSTRPGWRTFGLSEMAETLLSDELLWAQAELALFADAEQLTANARRLTLLRLEENWRRVNAT